MANDKWVVQCYSFSNSMEYNKAKKEQETIAYIRANTNMSSDKVVAKLYESLIEKETFDTIIGYAFLEELRQILMSNQLLTEDSLPPIPVKTKDPRLVKENVAKDNLDRYKSLLEKANHKKKLSLLANFFLVLVVIAMLTLSFVTKNKAGQMSETELLNKYASWKQELEQKEEELEQREEQLNQLQDAQ